MDNELVDIYRDSENEVLYIVVKEYPDLICRIWEVDLYPNESNLQCNIYRYIKSEGEAPLYMYSMGDRYTDDYVCIFIDKNIESIKMSVNNLSIEKYNGSTIKEEIDLPIEVAYEIINKFKQILIMENQLTDC